MKKIINVLAVIAAVTLPGCTKEHSPEVNSDGEMVLVHLNLGGEIDVEETPLTRAFTSDDLIGVQVYQGSKAYAYGLFDGTSNISLYLHSGQKYSFECFLVKNGKNILSNVNRNDPISLGGYLRVCLYQSNCYALPFLAYHYSNRFYYGRALSNKFVYDSGECFSCFSKGQLSEGSNLSTRDYSNGTIFYGKVIDVVAGDSLMIPIDMKCGSFGIKLSVTGITDGNVSVTIKNSKQTFHTYSNITEDKEFGVTMWTIYDLAGAYKYADNYAENFTIGVVWNRGVGVTQDLGTKTVQFKRNAVNHVKINLSSSTKSSGVAVSLEEPVITNETYSIGN